MTSIPPSTAKVASEQPVSTGPAKAPLPGGIRQPQTGFAEVLRRGARGVQVGGHAPSVSQAGKTGDPFAPPRPSPVGAKPKHDGHADREPLNAQRRKQRDKLDLLDPHARHAAQLGASASMVADTYPHAAQATEAATRASLQTLLPELVKRIAVSREGSRTGTVRLEIGRGALSGSTLLVRSNEGKVTVHLSAASGVDTDEWRGRIQSALRERGVDVESIEVD
jgi:hypothetical protein